MKKKTVVLIAALALVALLGGAFALYARLGQEAEPAQLAAQEPQIPEESAGTEATEEPEKVPAPDFTVYDAEGNGVRLSDFAGKPVVLNFWASWCGPCKMEMPGFEEKYQALGEDVSFLMINMTDGGRETVETASEFIAQQGYTFPVYYDTAAEAAAAYGAYSLPVTFFIDAEGYAVAYAAGAIGAEMLQRGIDMTEPPE